MLVHTRVVVQKIFRLTAPESGLVCQLGSTTNPEWMIQLGLNEKSDPTPEPNEVKQWKRKTRHDPDFPVRKDDGSHDRLLHTLDQFVREDLFNDNEAHLSSTPVP